MTKPIKLFLGLGILVLFSTTPEAATKQTSVVKCVDAAGNVTFTTLGCGPSETNASAITPTQAAEASTSTATDTPEAKSSPETNSPTTSSNNEQQPIAQPAPVSAESSSQQNASPTGNKREKLGEGSPDSIGVGAGF